MDAASHGSNARLEAARERLLEQLRLEISDEGVLRAIAKVPREAFIPGNSRHLAYEDRPLPIAEGQTISQPFIVALMTQALELVGTEKVLELGTGSGYQTAILAEMAREVITVERFPNLAERAKQVLGKLGYANVQVHLAEKNLGWRAEAPYDAIMVTAAAPRIPKELVSQLAVNGRMVIPVGSRWDQDLLQVRKQERGMAITNLTTCRFVPLIGEEGWSEE
jgi:protein-L-isoaspartate(D-aspartate) O-methyltransferase